jgi:3-phenylpropionate/cinnamic acid dioxygenase small subunit
VTSVPERPAQDAIERACARLLLQSIRLFDQGDWNGFAQLFTPDGVFVRANEPAAPLAGRAAIVEALTARPAQRLTRHVCTNIEIETGDEARAQGRCYLLLYSADASQPADVGGHRADAVQRIGEYHDVYVRTSEGWRIARRTGKLILYTARSVSGERES